MQDVESASDSHALPPRCRAEPPLAGVAVALQGPRRHFEQTATIEMASDSDFEVEVATPVLQVGPTLTALESSENAVFTTAFPTVVTRQEAQVALGRLRPRTPRPPIKA